MLEGMCSSEAGMFDVRIWLSHGSDDRLQGTAR
jgi:hypothetical protein